MAAGEVVAQEAIDAAGEVLEAVAEESGELAQATRGLSSREAGLIVGGLGIGIALGFAGSYFFLNNRLRTKYEDLLNDETLQMRELYVAKMQALDGVNEKSQHKAEQIAEREGYSRRDGTEGGPVPYHKAGETPEEEAPEVDEPQVRNVLEEDRVEGDDLLALNADWNYEKELKTRNPNAPYVIHRDEYDEGPHGDKEHEKHHLTYFAGDDVLSDERDKVLDDKDGVVGIENLARFGHGSGDQDTVYIRNESLQVDIELTRSDGNYATEVHGFKDDEIRHSSMARRIPRRSDFDGDS